MSVQKPIWNIIAGKCASICEWNDMCHSNFLLSQVNFKSATVVVYSHSIPPLSLLEQLLWNELPRTIYRARNNGRSTDNVPTDCGFDWSNFRLAGHVDRSKFNRIENEINLRFLLFSYFSCYLSSCCVLRNFDMKSWRHTTRAVVYKKTDIEIKLN